MDAAELSTDSRNALKGGTFAYPKQRKLPLSDASHVRNALARFNQVQGVSAEEKAAAKSKIRAAAKKLGVKVADDFAEWERFGEPLLVAGPGRLIEPPAEFGEVVRVPYVSVGEWSFKGDYGEIAIGLEDLDHIVDGFQKGARRQDLPMVAGDHAHPGLPLNEEHAELPEQIDPESYIGPGAVGWIKNLERDGDTVYADVELNRLGERLIQEDRYRGVSPELFLSWTDPETDEEWGMTAAGLALTTAPRMKGLAKQGAPLDERLAASEPRVLAFVESAAVHIDGPMQGFSVSYAYPAKSRLPLHSAAAVKGARARFMTVDAAEPERDEAWGRIREAAQQHGVDVPETWRALKASECAALLLQEGDTFGTDDDAGLQAPCIYQPAQGSCPGYTRSDPDGDGDADCCLMASRGCNGYVPLPNTWATDSSSQGAVYGYAEPTKKGEPMPEEPQPQNQNPEPPPAGDPATPAAAPAASTAVTPATVTVTNGTTSPNTATITYPATTTTASPTAITSPPPASSTADMAEFRNLLAAEKAEREAMTAKLSEAQDKIRRMEAAEGLKAVADRLEACVRDGRMTPSERAQLSERTAHFAEHPWLLEVFEGRAKGSAVPFGERGSGETDADLSDGEKLDRAAKALMSERQQSVDPKGKDFYKNYRAAVVEVGRSGYRG